MDENAGEKPDQEMEKILICYICKKPVESTTASFDLVNRVAVHFSGKKSIAEKVKNVFSKADEKQHDCTLKYIKEISATGREVQLKEVKIDDIFRHHRELFVIINEQELPDPKENNKLPVI